MKFGIMQLVSGGFGRDAGEEVRKNLELVQLAEELGFHSTWVAEHHFSDYGFVPNTLQYLAAAASVTERIRLGAAVVVTTLHHPIRVAEEAAFLDVLSGGRLDLGVGRGYQPSEFAAFGFSPDESRDRFDESIAFLRKAWTATEPFDWDGQFTKGEQITITPQPVQQPHPPLWLACVSPATFEKAGQEGWQIMTSPNFTPVPMMQKNFNRYRETLRANGYDPATFSCPVMQQIYVGADEDAGFHEPEEACMAYFHKLSTLLPAEVKGGENSPDFALHRRTRERLTSPDMRYEYLYENSVCYGSAQRVTDRIRFLQEALDVDYLVGWFNFGNLDHRLAKDSMRRFADQVMPHFVTDDKVGALEEIAV